MNWCKSGVKSKVTSQKTLTPQGFFIPAASLSGIKTRLIIGTYKFL
nr:MAG TPA: hypothetical protein [Bacteriophage sp.]